MWPQFLYAVEFVAGPFDGHKHVGEQAPYEWPAMIGVPIVGQCPQADPCSRGRQPIPRIIFAWRWLCGAIRRREDRWPCPFDGRIALYELQARDGAWCYRYLSATSVDHLREIQLLHESR